LLQSDAYIFLNCQAVSTGKKEETEVGDEDGEGLAKKLEQIWSYLFGIFFNSFPNYTPIRELHVY